MARNLDSGDGGGGWGFVFWVAILPAAFFEIRSTEKIKKVRAGDLVDKEEAATHVAWFYALLFNTALVIFAGMILSLVYWMILTSVGVEMDKPL
jgi:hypothetical protein